MKKVLTAGIIALVSFIALPMMSHAQEAKKEKKVKTVKSMAIDTPNDDVAALHKPGNDKSAKPNEKKSRGDVFGSNYSDIVVSNHTQWYVDVYVDGNYRITLSPYTYNTTWALPGNTRLNAKAQFDDGTYKYWGPNVTYTGYRFDWGLW